MTINEAMEKGLAGALRQSHVEIELQRVGGDSRSTGARYHAITCSTGEILVLRVPPHQGIAEPVQEVPEDVSWWTIGHSAE